MPEIFVCNEFECSENMQMIFDEYVAAIKKHPKFCDKFTAYSLLHAKHDERLAKKKTQLRRIMRTKYWTRKLLK